MGNLWIKFGCFLTGYNYGIVMNSSEVAVKTVKRYTSALIIVCLLWAFVGYVFTGRYLGADPVGCVFGSVVLVVIIIQVERQIILSIRPGKLLVFSRGLIAIMMAVIGTIIIDQILFKDDIELEKANSIENRVKSLLPAKTAQLQKQIDELNLAIKDKENEKDTLQKDVEKHPHITVYNSQPVSKTTRVEVLDDFGKPKIESKTEVVIISVPTSVPNPKGVFIVALQKSIDTLQSHKSAYESALLNIRPTLERDIASKIGFLDELEVMFSLISKSTIAMIVWLIWFFFLMGLELLVLVGKANEKEDDYTRTVQHQMELQIQKLNAFANAAKQS